MPFRMTDELVEVWCDWAEIDRKSTRLNSSHLGISYAVFCLKKKKISHELSAHIAGITSTKKRHLTAHVGWYQQVSVILVQPAGHTQDSQQCDSDVILMDGHV